MPDAVAALLEQDRASDRGWRSHRRWLLVIIAVSLLARLGFLAAFPQTLSLSTSGYDSYAVHLPEGRGFTRFEDRSADTDVPPLYPFFLAAVYALLGRGPIQVALVQTALDGLTIFLLYRIGRRVGGQAVGLLSAAFYGLYPYLLYQNLTLNDTAIFILLLVTGIWLSYTTLDAPNGRHAAALGVIFGLAALTKALALVVWLVVAAWWLSRLGPRVGLRLGFVSGIAVAAVIVPWVIRNTLVDGQLVFISTNDGSNLHQGNNPCVVEYLRRGWDAQWVSCLASAPPGLSEAALDRWHRQQALEYLARHPGQWASLVATKLWVLWSPTLRPTSIPPGAAEGNEPVLIYNTPAFHLARIIHVLYFGPLLALGGLGILLAWRARVAVGPLLAVLAAVTIVYVVFHPSTRYRSPADPFLFIFSAYAVLRIRAWLGALPTASGVA